MHALPAAPAAPPRRQLFVGTTVACLAGSMLVGGMLAVWLLQRQRAIDGVDRRWIPEGVVIPEVASNVMLISYFTLCVFAQWAVYAARRSDRVHTGLALGVVTIVGLCIVNAQAYVYAQIDLAAAEGAYGPMFYAITGTMLALTIVGLVFTAVAAFRYLGGRTSDREVVSAHALFWYFLAAAYSAVWFVVYVTK
jgi:cytochrome c oxidase subunit 3